MCKSVPFLLKIGCLMSNYWHIVSCPRWKITIARETCRNLLSRLWSRGPTSLLFSDIMTPDRFSVVDRSGWQQVGPSAAFFFFVSSLSRTNNQRHSWKKSQSQNLYRPLCINMFSYAEFPVPSALINLRTFSDTCCCSHQYCPYFF